MLARSALTVAGAFALLAVGLFGPVAGASDVDVAAEVVDDVIEHVPSARAEDGSRVIDVDPLHEQRLAQLRDQARAEGVELNEPLGAAEGVLSEPLAAPIAFSMVGVEMPEGVGVSLRHRADGEEWSEWEAVHLHPEEAPDPDSDEADRGDGGHLSEPVWTGEADELQLRVDGGDPEDLEVHVIDGLGQNRDLGARVGDALGALAATVTGGGRPAAAEIDQPDLVTRSDWGANEDWRNGSPSYASEARAAVLHHTVTSNTYSQAEAPAVVRSIYSYHTRTRGWNDIGYNFLVDRFGTVYEGRAGGVEEPVIGAHAAGNNTGTIGVAFLGRHDGGGTGLSGAAEGAAAGLLTWLFDVHHIDADTATTLHSGREVAADAHRIVGHGDLGSTDCPGSLVRQRMPAIRDAVVGGQVPMFTDPRSVNGDGTISEDETVTVTAGMKPGGDWRFEVRDDRDEVVHRQDGNGDDVEADWKPNGASGNRYEWRLSSQGRRSVEGAVEVAGRDLVARIDTDGPVAGSVALSQEAFDDDEAEHAVIARNDVFADAMAGGPLAGPDGPLLLTPPGDRLHGTAGGELRRVLPDGGTVYVLGGTEPFPDAFVDHLEDDYDYDVVRLAGRERTHTAGLVAEEVLDRSGADEVMLARSAGGGSPWADALAGGAYGAHEGIPVLLTPSDQLTWKPEEVLEGVSRTTILGGTAAIEPGVAEQTPDPTRVAGSSRSTTAVHIARQLWGRTSGSDGDRFVVANGWHGDAWQLTLASAPLAAREEAPLLLTLTDRAPDDVLDYLVDLDYDEDRHGGAWVLGTTLVLGDEPAAAVNARLQ